MKKILVTGGAGFIGSHTTDLLLQSGYEVIVYDNLLSGKIINLDLLHPKLELVQGCILDYALLSSHVQRVDAILHLAAIPSVPKSIEDPVSTLQINIQGWLHVLQAVRECEKTIRLVYASSAAVYGEAVQLPCSDDVFLTSQSLSPYALEKASDERYAQLFEYLFGIKSIGLRYFNVFGPRQDPASPYSGVISKFIDGYVKNEPITVLGDGKQTRDFIYVADVARANLLALQSDHHAVMNVATGKQQTLHDLIRAIEKAGGADATVRFADPRVGDIRHSYATVEKAASLLSFRAAIPFDVGIKQLLDFLRR